jgi:hypothetical protein
MASPDQPLDQRRLTFSQEQGLAPLPSQLKLGEISTEFRSVLWSYMFQELERRSFKSNLDRRTHVGGPWRAILPDTHVLLFHRPADEFQSHLLDVQHFYKKLIWEGSFNQVFDFLQFAMRHPACEEGFAPKVRGMLEYCRAAYSILDQGPTIVPIGSDEEIKTLVDAFAATKHEAFPGAGAHLRLAVEALNSGRYGDSVRESVHAVESAARVLSEDAKATLAPALHQLVDCL